MPIPTFDFSVIDAYLQKPDGQVAGTICSNARAEFYREKIEHVVWVMQCRLHMAMNLNRKDWMKIEEIQPFVNAGMSENHHRWCFVRYEGGQIAEQIFASSKDEFPKENLIDFDGYDALLGKPVKLVQSWNWKL